MIGDKYEVRQDCQIGRFKLKQGDILTETGAFNFETEEVEEGGEYNDLIDENFNFICEVGSNSCKKNLAKIASQTLTI